MPKYGGSQFVDNINNGGFGKVVAPTLKKSGKPGNRLPVLFSVIEDWDLNPAEEDTNNKQCPAHHSANKELSNANQDNVESQKIIDVTSTKSEEPVLPFIRIMKIDKGGDFAPADKCDVDEKDTSSRRHVAMTTTTSATTWPKTMRRSTETRFSSYNDDAVRQIPTSSVATKTIGDDRARQDLSICCDDPKPAFAPLRRNRPDSVANNCVRRSAEATTTNNLHKHNSGEFDDQVQYRLFQPSVVFDVEKSIIGGNANSTAFTRIKPKTENTANGVETFSPLAVVAQLPPPTSRVVEENIADWSINRFLNSYCPNGGGSGSTPSSTTSSNRSPPFSLVPSPDMFNPILSEHDDVINGFSSMTSQQRPNSAKLIVTDSIQQSRTFDYVANQYGISSFRTISSANSDQPMQSGKNAFLNSFIPNLPVFAQKPDAKVIVTQENNTAKKPAVFNIYQQYEQYGLDDDFQFPLIANLHSSSVNFTKNGAVKNCTTSISPGQNGFRHKSSSPSVQYPLSSEFYGQSLFSQGSNDTTVSINNLPTCG